MFDLSLPATKTELFGQAYVLEKINSVEHPYGVFIKDRTLVVNRFGASVSFKNLYERFLKNTASKYIIPRTHYLGQKMKLEFGQISLKQQKTRWGSCSSKRNLNFNWRLVHFSPQIIDYVIIHELSHLVHMNHSRNFWQLVSRYDPEYTKHRGFLRRVEIDLG